MQYETFLKIAAGKVPPGTSPNDAEAFFWLWRSCFADYAQCSRIWHDWLYRTLLWWYRTLLLYKSVWVNSFEVYDKLSESPTTEACFAPTSAEIARISEGDLEKYGVKSQAQLKVRRGFMDLRDVLVESLKQACDDIVER